jgi:hypothetical protein
VGCDWSGYLNIFELQRYATLEDALNKSEPAFWAVNDFLHAYSLEYPYINVFAAAVFFVGLHALARRQPDRLGFLILSFPVLILNLAMSATRQAIAVGLMCWAFNAFMDRRLLRYVFFIILAASFHSSALSFLMLVPFIHGRLSAQRIALAGVLLMPGAYFLLSSEIFQTYSSRYVGAGADAAGAPFRTGLLALTGSIHLLFLNKKWKLYFPGDPKLVTILSWLMLIVFPLAFLSPIIGDRFGFYLNPAQLIVLVHVACLYRGLYLVSLLPYALGGLVLTVWTQYSDLFALCYLPYKVWW